MARAIWSGTISFGLLNVPVKVYSAVSAKTVRFNQLNKETGTRISMRRVDPATGEEVPYENLVKGYEISPDRYVVITPEELESLEPEKTRMVDILSFVDLDQIDPIYFDQPYYLGPAEGAEKAYSLLVKAMSEEGKVAIGRFVLRNREHLAALRPMDGVLTMATMRFPDEVVSPKELDDVFPAETPKVQKREVEMARQLIDSLASDFEPSQYKDEYREELLALIERKAEGKEIVSRAGEEPEPTKAPDLMAALEESLAAVRGEDLGGGAQKRDGGSKRKAPAKSKSKSGSTSRRSKSKSKTRS